MIRQQQSHRVVAWKSTGEFHTSVLRLKLGIPLPPPQKKINQQESLSLIQADQLEETSPY